MHFAGYLWVIREYLLYYLRVPLLKCQHFVNIAVHQSEEHPDTERLL